MWQSKARSETAPALGTADTTSLKDAVRIAEEGATSITAAASGPPHHLWATTSCRDSGWGNVPVSVRARHSLCSISQTRAHGD